MSLTRGAASTRSCTRCRVWRLSVTGVRMASRICAEPNCPTIIPQGTRDGRCDEHRRARDRARGSSTERGYGAGHQRLRVEYQRRMNRGESFDCWRCGDEIDPECWHLGHDDEDRSRYRGPECVPCNVAVAGRA